MTAQTATSLADSRVFRYPIEVKFGDCDPAGIVFGHRIQRDETLVCEGFEKRFVGILSTDEPPRVKAIEIPTELVVALTRTIPGR